MGTRSRVIAVGKKKKTFLQISRKSHDISRNSETNFWVFEHQNASRALFRDRCITLQPSRGVCHSVRNSLRPRKKVEKNKSPRQTLRWSGIRQIRISRSVYQWFKQIVRDSHLISRRHSADSASLCGCAGHVTTTSIHFCHTSLGPKPVFVCAL